MFSGPCGYNVVVICRPKREAIYSMSNYDDIINMDRPVSKRHTPMSREMRAAQFAPFAALTGLDETMDETADAHRIGVEAEIIREEFEEAP